MPACVSPAGCADLASVRTRRFLGSRRFSRSFSHSWKRNINLCMNKTEYFDRYVEAGLKVIPLYARSKIPVWPRWNGGWDRDRCRKYIVESPDCNLGILLGEIVDVEGDTDDANSYLNSLLRNYQHPQYRSSKSIHHLFLNPDPRLTSTRFNGLEFRGWKHQSVLPPSVHESGTNYHWLSDSVFTIPRMPPDLYRYYMENRPVPKKSKSKNYLKPGHRRTLCTKCAGAQFIHEKRLKLEVMAFAEFNMKWQCHGCRPVDVRPTCRRIRKSLGI